MTSSRLDNFIKVMTGRVDKYPDKEFEFTKEEMVHIERMRKIPKSVKIELNLKEFNRDK